MYKDEYISAMRKVSAPAGLRARLVEAMENPPQQKPARLFPRAWAGVIAAAAALAIALPVWLGGVKMGGASAGGTMSTAAYAMDTTAAAQEAEAAPGEDAAEAGNGAAPRATLYDSASLALSDTAHMTPLNPTENAAEEELPGALCALAYTGGEEALRADVEALGGALGLELTGLVYDEAADAASATAEMNGSTITLTATAQGASAEIPAEAQLEFEAVRGALGELSLSRAGDGAALAETSRDENGVVRHALAGLTDGGAAQSLAGYARSLVTARCGEDGALVRVTVAANARETGEALALRTLSDARAEADAMTPDGYEVVRWALGWDAAGTPCYFFDACDGAGVCVTLCVNAVA